MKVIVNGEPRSLPDGTTVAELVAQVAGDGRGSAVAVDGSVVPRGAWPTQKLRDGTTVELLTAVQGG